MSQQRQRRRALGLPVAIALSASLLACGGLRARADDDSPQSQEAVRLQNTPVDVDLDRAPLRMALKLIEQKTHISIVFKDSAHQFGTVTLSVKSRPISDVLRLIAASAGADIWLEDGIYWVGPRGS